jgi:hypothetical protein
LFVELILFVWFSASSPYLLGVKENRHTTHSSLFFGESIIHRQ